MTWLIFGAAIAIIILVEIITSSCETMTVFSVLCAMAISCAVGAFTVGLVWCAIAVVGCVIKQVG